MVMTGIIVTNKSTNTMKIIIKLYVLFGSGNIRDGQISLNGSMNLMHIII